MWEMHPLTHQCVLEGNVLVSEILVDCMGRVTLPINRGGGRRGAFKVITLSKAHLHHATAIHSALQTPHYSHADQVPLREKHRHLERSWAGFTTSWPPFVFSGMLNTLWSCCEDFLGNFSSSCVCRRTPLPIACILSVTQLNFGVDNCPQYLL